jgi:hypothetical protein
LGIQSGQAGEIEFRALELRERLGGIGVQRGQAGEIQPTALAEAQAVRAAGFDPFLGKIAVRTDVY